MNLKNLVLSVLVACVAVTSAACVPLTQVSDSPVVVQSTPNAPDTIVPEGYDELVNWTDGYEIDSAQAFADDVGLRSIMAPYESYMDLGYIGVSEFGSQCIVVFAAIDDLNDGLISFAILSRFDFEKEIAYAPSTIEQIAEELRIQLPGCSTITSS